MSVFTRGTPRRNFGVSDQGLPPPLNTAPYYRGAMIRGGANALNPPRPAVQLDMTDRATYTNPVIPPYQPRGL